jgi:hypothetical protein
MTIMDHAPAKADVLKGVKIIGCDAHFTEPPELWTSRSPANLVNRMPILRTVDGVTPHDYMSPGCCQVHCTRRVKM